MAEHLRRIVPEARIAVGHGQMEERELEQVMLSFMHGESNLLLCTTIIESGLDIPNANTLIVNRADAFGLSQLYQLRGRVGRSRQRAYAYFLIPGEMAISAMPGSGEDSPGNFRTGCRLRIAPRPGDPGGRRSSRRAQTGNIAAVGFELYTEMLEEKSGSSRGRKCRSGSSPEIKLHIPAFIPEDYVKDPNQRLVIYKKLSQVESAEEVADVRDELVDRFGKLPLAAMYLLEVMGLRLLLKNSYQRNRIRRQKNHHRFPSENVGVAGCYYRDHKEGAPHLQFTPDYRLIAEIRDTSFEGVLAETTKILKMLS